jgi:hypothetical protein
MDLHPFVYTPAVMCTRETPIGDVRDASQGRRACGRSHSGLHAPAWTLRPEHP